MARGLIGFSHAPCLPRDIQSRGNGMAVGHCPYG